MHAHTNTRIHIQTHTHTHAPKHRNITHTCSRVQREPASHSTPLTSRALAHMRTLTHALTVLTNDWHVGGGRVGGPAGGRFQNTPYVQCYVQSPVVGETLREDGRRAIVSIRCVVTMMTLGGTVTLTRTHSRSQAQSSTLQTHNTTAIASVFSCRLPCPSTSCRTLL